jgi:hypothetical protein
MTISLMARASEGPVATKAGFRSRLSILTACLPNVAVHMHLTEGVMSSGGMCCSRRDARKWYHGLLEVKRDIFLRDLGLCKSLVELALQHDQRCLPTAQVFSGSSQFPFSFSVLKLRAFSTYALLRGEQNAYAAATLNSTTPRLVQALAGGSQGNVRLCDDHRARPVSRFRTLNQVKARDFVRSRWFQALRVTVL